MARPRTITSALVLVSLMSVSLWAQASPPAHGYLGILFDAQPANVTGCLVRDVDPNGGAAKSGIKAGDLITSIAGSAIAKCEDILPIIARTGVGQRLAVIYLRSGQQQSVNVVLGSAPPPGTKDVPTSPITLNENPRMVRLTVGHVHMASNCFGYLDVTADTVTYTSLTQPEHSFKVARTALQDIKPSCENCNAAAWAHFHTTQNYNFVLLDPKYVNGQATWKWHFGKTGLENVEDAKFITNYLRDFDATWTADWAEIQARLHPKPPEPTPTPTPATARVLMVTDPGGAQVYVDDVFKGESSDKGELRVEGPPGSHTVRVRLAGYKEWTGNVAFDGAQETKQNVVLLKRGPEPLAESDLEDALSQGMTPARLADLVKQYGVNFQLTDDVEKKLRAAGADDGLLLEIAKNKR